jgi:hypothetical protein
MQQRADFGAKYGRQRATLDTQKIRKINAFAIFGSGYRSEDQEFKSP